MYNLKTWNESRVRDSNLSAAKILPVATFIAHMSKANGRSLADYRRRGSNNIAKDRRDSLALSQLKCKDKSY